MSLAVREWNKLIGTDIGADFSLIENVLEQCQKTYNKTDSPGFILAQRNGRIVQSGPDPLEFCERALYRTQVEGFCKHYLIAWYPKVLSEIPGRDLRLLRKFELDAVFCFFPETPNNILMGTLDIADAKITGSQTTKSITRADLREVGESDFFRNRELQVDFKKREWFYEKSPKNAFLLHVEFTTERFQKGWSPESEFRALAKTLNFDIVDAESQKLSKPQTGSFIGSGKLEEILTKIESQEFTHILLSCDAPLSFKKMLTQRTLIDVWDRTTLILEIFKAHARTRKSELEIELAQTQYNGETIIHNSLMNYGKQQGLAEYEDKQRAHLTEKKRELRKAIEKIHEQEKIKLKKRIQERPLSLALVGYTNAGKSTLFNQFLKRKEVAVANELFKTLDTTTRVLQLSTHSNILISDTVGFIQNMPAHLDNAFFSTFEEVKLCTNILILLDPKGIKIKEQLECIIETLEKVGRTDKENWMIALNKKDTLDMKQIADYSERFEIDFFLSAKESQSVLDFQEFIIEKVCETTQNVTLKLDYAQYGQIHQLKDIATIKGDPEYKDDHILVDVSYLPENEYKVEQILGIELKEKTTEEWE
jgi:GTP-binding protein HflX